MKSTGELHVDIKVPIGEWAESDHCHALLTVSVHGHSRFNSAEVAALVAVAAFESRQPLEVYGYNPFTTLTAALDGVAGARVEGATDSHAIVDDLEKLSVVLQRWRSEHHLIARGVGSALAQTILEDYVTNGTLEFVYRDAAVLEGHLPIVFHESTCRGAEIVCSLNAVDDISRRVLDLRRRTA